MLISPAAAIRLPHAMIGATQLSDHPDENSRPAMMGPNAAPPRPNPMTNPVPPARSDVGKDWARIPYRPAVAPVVNRPARAATVDNAARLVRPCPNTATAMAPHAIAAMTSSCNLYR